MAYRHKTIPRNIMRGIVPTFTGFDTTAPTALANATDGNPATATTEGKKTIGGAGIAGTFEFDLGAVKNILLMASVDFHSSAGTVSVFASTESVFTSQASVQAATATAQTCSLTKYLYGRYVTLTVYGGSASDVYAAARNVSAYEVDP